MSLFGNLKLILSLQCRDASALIAEGADRQLTRSERWALGLHLAYCSSCRRFRKQLAFLGRLWTELERRLIAGEVPLEESLSESSRERMQRIIDSGLAP
jgi:hypothetical protein